MPAPAELMRSRLCRSPPLVDVQKELHRLVDEVDCGIAKRELHVVFEEFNEKQAREALSRLRDSRDFFEKHGFAV
jgi:hypothetical protein